MRISAVLIASLFASPAFAQYQYDLATTRDGLVLYFSYLPTSTSRDTKIYRWSHDAGVTLFGDRPDLAQPPSYGQHLYGTQTTYEGTVLYHAEARCFTGFGPGLNNCSVGETQVVIPNLQPFSVSGFLLISPNGRYGVFAAFDGRGLWVDWFTGEQIEVDFHNQSIPNLTPPFYVNQHAVANNGSFLITAPDKKGVRIWSKSGEIVLPAPDVVQNATISSDGGTVTVTARDPAPSFAIPTYVYDLPSGRKTMFPQLVSMSEDGQTVAYLTEDVNSLSAHAQAMVARSDGTGVRQITNVPDGIRSAVLSGDARYLYVVVGKNAAISETSRIQRFEVATGAVEDIPVVP